MEGIHYSVGKSRALSESDYDFECVGLGEWEEPDLPIWIGAAFRRYNEFQHVRDAPRTLPDLLQWLRNVSEFEEVSGLECPNFKAVWDLAVPSWAGVWTPKAILSFQAVANSSAIMHPPLSVRLQKQSSRAKVVRSPGQNKRRRDLWALDEVNPSALSGVPPGDRSNSSIDPSVSPVGRSGSPVGPNVSRDGRSVSPVDRCVSPPGDIPFRDPVPVIVLSDSGEESADENRDDISLSFPDGDETYCRGVTRYFYKL